MNRRIMHVYCDSDNGASVQVSQEDWTADEGDPSIHISIKTTGGQMVYTKLKDARELAGWLIEHAAEHPDPSWRARSYQESPYVHDYTSRTDTCDVCHYPSHSRGYGGGEED